MTSPTRMTEVERLPSEALQEIYKLMAEVLAEELSAAERIKRKRIGWKVALTRIRVKLSKVSKLCKDARKEILEMRKNDGEMEKYGVAEDETPSKSAGSGCPTCGKDVEEHGDVKKCPNCGTEPFEGFEGND